MTKQDLKIAKVKRNIALGDDLALFCLISIIVGLIVLAAVETQTISNLLRVIWP